MPDIRSEVEGVTIVLLGNFNPKIFQPAWFAHHGLIRIEEAETAENLVAVPELTTFTAAWLSIQVIPERFQASTTDAAHFEALRDLVFGTFRLLEHTPFNKMGINRDMHFKMHDESTFIAFGHFLVPKTPWKPLLDDPRTRSLTVEGSVSRGQRKAKLTIKVEPSGRVPLGIFFSTNEHYEETGDRPGPTLMSILQAHWSDAQDTARSTAERLLGQAT